MAIELSKPALDAGLRVPRAGTAGELPRLLFALAALAAAGGWALLHIDAAALGTQTWLLAASAVVGAYMAMNIGANDVATNMGPAVGSRALTLSAALAVAAVFEVLGAVVAGGAVTSTIKGGIIDPGAVAAADFAWLMLAALLAAALWLHLATALHAPVSTTHAIVGAVMGAGIAAGGWRIVHWATVEEIVASWIVSPLLGGVFAALFLYAIKRSITYRADMRAAAGRVVPRLIALMAWAFCTYMLSKGLGSIVKLPLAEAAGCGALVAALVFALTRAPIARAAHAGSNDKEGVNRLFTWPLACAAALLSFAHGANDVANAIGPLAAIYEAVAAGEVAAHASTPLWILVLGGAGLAAGLALYGGRLIRTVGAEITELDRMRAYAISMAAALTVIVASQLGMPISTTHVAIGAVLGVGLLREHIKRRHLAAGERQPVLVRRTLCAKIVAAWIVTVPASALLGAIAFRVLQWLA